MQPFKANDAMVNFYSLADSARLYDRAMGLWIKYTNLFTVDYHTVKYEHLVDDLEYEIGKLLGFLQVEWHDDVLDYAKHARRRGRISTPSYNQVTRPIYQDAKYRWRRYAGHMEVAKDSLSPYIRQFEYD